MATETFNAQWVDVYGNARKLGSSPPFRIGSSAQHHTLVKIPDAVKTAINTSSTTPSLDMIVNFTSGSNDIDIGYHRERNSRTNGSTGIPWYAYLETWRNGGGTGSKTYPMTSWFMPNFLNGNTQGVVMYSYNGVHTASADKIQFRVTGTWNRPPTNPSSVRVDKTTPDIAQVIRWNASSDPDGDTVRYDVDFYNGSSWSRKISNTTSLSWSHNTTNERAVTNARYRVRATDGKEYSSWVNSPVFEIRHVPPSIAGSQLTYLDSNVTTRTITGNNQHIIQNASTVQASVASGATANDGKTIRRYIFTLSGQERIRTSVGAVTFDPINAGTNQTLRVTVEDSAGLRSSVTKTVTVIPYSPPEIQYEANRVGSIENNTILQVSGSISSLDGKNSLQLTQYRYRQTGTTNWSSAFTINRTVSGTNFTGSNVTINLDSSQEWEIEVIVSDKVLTRRVYLTVSRGKPVMFLDEEYDRLGIGKYPEFGALDVEGGAYFTGGLHVDGISVDKSQSFRAIRPTTMSDTIRNWQLLPHGYYFVRPNDIQGQPDSYGVIEVMKQGTGTSDDYNIIWYTQANGPIYRKSGNGNSMTGWIQIAPEVEQGGNSNGKWVRFSDGTQICWLTSFTVPYDINTRLSGTWNFPNNFSDSPAVLVTRDKYHGSGTLVGSSAGTGSGSSSAQIRLFAVNDTYFSSSDSAQVRLIAIGRWK